MQLQIKITLKRSSTDVAWGVPSTSEMNNPWTLLGFTDKPTWWDGQYGSNYNAECGCWADIKEGKIVQGDRAGTHSEYASPMVEYFAKDKDILDDKSKLVSEAGHDSLEWTSTHQFETYDDYCVYRDSWTDTDLETFDAYLNTKNVTQSVVEEYL